MLQGVDVAFSTVTQDWCRIRRLEGFDVFVQNLWPGGYANPLPNAALNLKTAHSQGFKIAGYVNTNPWFPAEAGIKEAKKNAGKEWDHLGLIFNDVEIPGCTEQMVKDMCLGLEAEGKRVAIYSGKWFWEGYMGNPMWPWLLGYPLWAAAYDGVAKLTAPVFGPWTEIAGKQYQDSTNLDGVSVDFNVFSEDLFEEGFMVDQAQIDRIEALAKDNNEWIKNHVAVDAAAIKQAVSSVAPGVDSMRIADAVIQALKTQWAK